MTLVLQLGASIVSYVKEYVLRLVPGPAPAAVFVLLLSLLPSGCRLTTAVREDDRVCRQTYEFGNYGCARVLVMFEDPTAPAPASYRYDVRAVPANDRDGSTPSAFAPNPGPGAVPLQLTLWSPLRAGDTLSVWVVARKLEDPRPVVVGVPLPVFAADSALRVLRFAPVGSVPKTDTVRLVLQRQ
jgi:hypothetical protein